MPLTIYLSALDNDSTELLYCNSSLYTVARIPIEVSWMYSVYSLSSHQWSPSNLQFCKTIKLCFTVWCFNVNAAKKIVNQYVKCSIHIIYYTLEINSAYAKMDEYTLNLYLNVQYYYIIYNTSVICSCWWYNYDMTILTYIH